MPDATAKVKRSFLFTRIKNSVDRIKNENLKQSALQAIPFFVASALVGVVAVAYARLFSLAEHFSKQLFNEVHWVFFAITPACFVVAWLLVKRFAPYAQGSGIPQVMASIELAHPKTYKFIGKLLSLRIIVIKVLSSIVIVFGGGAIGREGPTIQIAGSIFKKVNELLPAWWPKVSRRNMITAGAAAGLAAAFNTPLGGIVFSLEELSKTHISFFKTPVFAAVIIAGLTAQGLAGTYLYLGFPAIDQISFMSYLGILAVGAIAGLGGSLLSKCILGIMEWKSKLKSNWQQAGYVVFCALMIAGLAIGVSSTVMGSGRELMTELLFTENKYNEWYVPLLRFVGPLFSFTTGAATGIFAPALSAGATVGSLVSSWLGFSASDTNILILGGMVAFLTGVTRSPFTSAILVLEMTDRHSLIFHLILAGMVSSFVSIIVDKNGLYEHLKKKYLNEFT